MNLFILQLSLSFIFGASVITLLTFLAEKANKQVAGIIMTFPTTMALGMFFLAWATSPEEVSQVIPATFIPLGLSILFPVFYGYIAEFVSKYLHSKKIQISVSFLLAVATWLVLAVLVVLNQLDTLYLTVLAYFVMIYIAHLLLKDRQYEKPPTLTYTIGQQVLRSVFVGLTVFLVVLLGKLVNPFWGAVVSIFPAAYSVFITILHYYYGPTTVLGTLQNIPKGSLSLFVFLLTVMIAFPIVGFIWGTVVALVASAITTIFLMKLVGSD